MDDLMPLRTHSHRGKKILQKYSNHLNVLGAIKMKRSKFHLRTQNIRPHRTKFTRQRDLELGDFSRLPLQNIGLLLTEDEW